MRKRKVGLNGPEVLALGLGCMTMPESEESERTIHRALDLGINLLDTADVYGRGNHESELLIGKAIKERRESVVIATKFGLSANGIIGKPKYVKQACESSLQRLGTDHIDLYFQHRVDPATPIEETIGAMAELVKEGKVRYLGLSEASAEMIRRAHVIHPITALETEYSLWSRDAEDEILPVCRELGIGFIAYSPLARGFLSGSINSIEDLDVMDYRRLMPRFQDQNFERNFELVVALQKIAAKKGCQTSQLALAWLLSRGEDIIPIPGTKRIEYLEENLGALQIDLEKDDLALIEQTAPRGNVKGQRYPEEMMP